MELKSCPECFNEDVQLMGMTDSPNEPKDFIECTVCHYYWHVYDKYKSVEEAVKAWNSRKADNSSCEEL